MTPGEVAQAFNVDAVTVSRWAKDGKLPHTRTAGGHRRYLRTEIEALLRSQASWNNPGGVRALGLNPATESVLTRAGVNTIAELCRRVANDDLIGVDGMGIFEKNEIEGALRASGWYPRPSPCLTGQAHPVTTACRVRCLDISTSVAGALTRAGTRTVADALQRIERGDLRDVRGLGEKREAELRSALARAGFQPGGDCGARQATAETGTRPGAGPGTEVSRLVASPSIAATRGAGGGAGCGVGEGVLGGLEITDLEITDEDVTAIAHLLVREPVQQRSRERVRRLLQAALELAPDGAPMSMETIRVRAGLELASMYRYVDGADRVIRCLALIWRWHAISTVQAAAETGTACDARALARVLVAMQAGYRQISACGPPWDHTGRDEAGETQRRQLAETLHRLHAPHAQPAGSDGCGGPGAHGAEHGEAWSLACRVAVEIADTAARLALSTHAPSAEIADETITALSWYLEERDLVMPCGTGVVEGAQYGV